jgi:hypothetical protein
VCDVFKKKDLNLLSNNMLSTDNMVLSDNVMLSADKIMFCSIFLVTVTHTSQSMWKSRWIFCYFTSTWDLCIKQKTIRFSNNLYLFSWMFINTETKAISWTLSNSCLQKQGLSASDGMVLIFPNKSLHCKAIKS